MNALALICIFTFCIHVTESLAYNMRLAGLRTRKIAIAMSFVTSTLLVSRLSNLFQAPLLGSMVDGAVMQHSEAALITLEHRFRLVVCFGFLGSLAGILLSPTALVLFEKAMTRFMNQSSIPGILLFALKPRNLVKIFKIFRLPNRSDFKDISWSRLPKLFLILNVAVTSVYTIGVLCSLLAGAHMPHMRSTANQLSGIVNGLATIMMTLFVDPSGARITDQAYHGVRPESDVKAVVFFLQVGRLIGTLVLAQLLIKPFTAYIMWVTHLFTYTL